MAKKEKAKKVKRGIKALIIIAIIIGVIGATVGSIFIATVVEVKKNIKLAKSYASQEKDDALVPTLDENGYWTFTTDDEFVVLQLTDIHIGGGSFSSRKDKMAMKAISELVETSRPDLIIVTGDIAYPVPFSSGSFNNLNPTKIFANFMNSLGVFWTVTLGNHDSEVYSYYSREEIAKYYLDKDVNYAHNKNARCLYQIGPEDVDGYGNYFINVKNSQGIITQAVMMMDSHSYIEGDSFGIKWRYDNIHQNQIDWYANEINKLDAQNKLIDNESPMIKSLAFFHIPLQEYLLAWTEYMENDYKDTENVKLVYGGAGESGKIVYCGVYPDKMFETMLELGSTQGIFVGHDHLNNFSLDYKGIRLTYGMSIDYLAYMGISKKVEQRGGTVITITPDGSFDCYGLRLHDKAVLP
ncbi:MAG: hypothetical protein GX242_01010 [Clostridiales bacterium]|nr:hypothetical protein [Clostridiales bacterium]